MLTEILNGAGETVRLIKDPVPLRGAVIEIIERTSDPDPDVIVPNEVRINGQPLMCSADDPVIVHEVSSAGHDVVRVTLTLFARRVVFDAEPK